MFRFLLLASLVLFFSCKPKNELQKSTQNEKELGVISEKAMVVSAHPLATKAGLDILKKGGNAVDAAVAVQFALTVVYPRAGNIGGGGFMIFREENGQLHSLDFREQGPAASFKTMYLDKNGNVIPRLSLDGPLAAGVSGVVDGMFTAHKKFGRLLWSDLVQPAIDLAEKGHKISAIEAEYMRDNQENFKNFSIDASCFAKKDGEWQAGDLWVQADLAETFKRIQEKGRAGFYEGKTADLIVDEMKSGNGIITHQDLLDYHSKWRTPLVGNYKNEYKIISMGPPSSGGIALLQMCEMMEQFNIKDWGFQSVKTSHVIIEAERLSYADRATHMGDLDFYPVPIDGLLDEEYIKDRASEIDLEKATRSSQVRAGNPEGAIDSKTGGTPKESIETTHFSIVDEWGNAVSQTTTLNSNYGSKVIVKGGGFLLNNEMDDFSAKPNVPNQFGLVGNEANAIVPGKRMLSSMTPTIIEKNDKLFMVLGTPGGATIITSVFQNFLNVVEFGMGMQEAVTAPRFHHQWLPDTVYIEKNAFGANTEKLKEMGHRFQERGSLIERKSIGKVDAILIREDGKLEGAADIRGEDKAMGY